MQKIFVQKNLVKRSFLLKENSNRYKIRERVYDQSGRLRSELSYQRNPDELVGYSSNVHKFDYLKDQIILETIGEEQEDKIFITRKLDDQQRVVYEAKVYFGDQIPAPYHFEYEFDKLVAVKQEWRNGDVYYIGAERFEHQKENSKPELDLQFDWKNDNLRSITDKTATYHSKVNLEYAEDGAIKMIELKREVSGNITSQRINYLGNGLKRIELDAPSFKKKESHDLKQGKFECLCWYFEEQNFSYGIDVRVEEKNSQTVEKQNNDLEHVEEETIQIIIHHEIIKDELEMPQRLEKLYDKFNR